MAAKSCGRSQPNHSRCENNPTRTMESVSFDMKTGITVEPAMNARAAMKNVPFRTPNVKFLLKCASL